jgi:hypothetical protein
MNLEHERDELNALCELLVQDVRVARSVARGILEENQLQVAATRDLLAHLEMVGPTDALTKALCANVRRALGHEPPAPLQRAPKQADVTAAYRCVDGGLVAI